MCRPWPTPLLSVRSTALAQTTLLQPGAADERKVARDVVAHGHAEGLEEVDLVCPHLVLVDLPVDQVGVQSPPGCQPDPPAEAQAEHPARVAGVGLRGQGHHPVQGTPAELEPDVEQGCVADPQLHVVDAVAEQGRQPPGG